MPNKKSKKTAGASYLREFYGPFNNNEPNQLLRKEEKKYKKHKKLGPKDLRSIT
jgi:hypothetical protein